MKKITNFIMVMFLATMLKAQQWNGVNDVTSPINRNGNVSIGTDQQLGKLTVNGVLRQFGGPIVLGKSNRPNNYNYQIEYSDTVLIIRPKSDYLSNLNEPIPSVFSTFVIGNNEKIGMGTSSIFNCTDCADYRLFVKDGIKTEKVKVEIAANNGWADYVFNKNYELMPLNKLEQYITENKHLPEVPTTDEAIKNGIELKEFNILLLKKIEELTLYTIEQQKVLDAQLKRIEALENKIISSK